MKLSIFLQTARRNVQSALIAVVTTGRWERWRHQILVMVCVTASLAVSLAEFSCEISCEFKLRVTTFQLAGCYIPVGPLRLYWQHQMTLILCKCVSLYMMQCTKYPFLIRMTFISMLEKIKTIQTTNTK